MRSSIVIMIAMSMSVAAMAHHPDRANRPVRPRIDLIGPLGNRLPMSYRRRYNRPKYWKGKVEYWIEPVSREAMAWHRAEHKGYYENKSPRMVTHYFYPKPWEVARIGARPERSDLDPNSQATEFEMPYGRVEELPEVDVMELPPGGTLDAIPGAEGMIDE